MVQNVDNTSDQLSCVFFLSINKFLKNLFKLSETWRLFYYLQIIYGWFLLANTSLSILFHFTITNYHYSFNYILLYIIILLLIILLLHLVIIYNSFILLFFILFFNHKLRLLLLSYRHLYFAYYPPP